MILEPLFDLFVNKSPLSVMARATVQHVLSASELDTLFNGHAELGYEKQLLFSTMVDLMSLVVSGNAPHVKSAFEKIQDRVPVTLKCVYEKLQKIERSVSRERVRHVGGRCATLVDELGGACEPLSPGRRTRILDGNHLAATQRRLTVTRGRSAGPLPGQVLAILDPERMLITNIIPCEDGHAQERSLFDQIMPLVREKDLWIADRNFCPVDFAKGLSGRSAAFVVRRHAGMTAEAQTDYGEEVETDTGWVGERMAWIVRDGVRELSARMIRLRLKQATEDGDREVELLTNLTAEEADAVKVAGLYRSRWKSEGAFHELTVTLKCELNTLGYPRAALFAFAVAVTAYNVMAVLKGAMRAAHGEKKVREEGSGYYMGLELASILAGMMTVLPGPDWDVFGGMPTTELAVLLREWAGKIDMLKIRKCPPRKPTKNKTIKIKDKSPHLSTAKLLQEEKLRKQAERQARKVVANGP